MTRDDERTPEAAAYARDVLALVDGCLERIAATELDLEVEPMTTWDPTRA